MIKPPPLKFSCPACNWQKTTYPKSDALAPGDYFSTCPKCGNEELEIHPASGPGILGMLGKLFSNNN